MSTELVMSVTDELIAELEQLAISVKGWNMPHAFQEPEEGFLPKDWEWYVGQIDEQGNKYPVLNVNAHQYDSEDSEKLSRYYAACNRDTILALLAERAELKLDAERYRWLKENVKTDFYGDQLINMFTCSSKKIDRLIDAAMKS